MATQAPTFSLIIDQTLATILASPNLLIHHDNFTTLFTLFTHLSRLAPIPLTTPSPAIDILSRQIATLHALTLACSRQNRIYLLLTSRHTSRLLQTSTREIARALALLPLTPDLEHLPHAMATAEFHPSIDEQEVLNKIDSAILHGTSDRAFANDLLNLIADAAGILKDRSSLRREFDEFRNEIAHAKMSKNLEECIQLDQIIALLGRADSTLSFKEREMKYHSKRNTLGSQPLEPLQSFYCPITRDVMEDPVETSSGQTFERSAIEKWFCEGNSNCPLTMVTLNTEVLRPNITLRKSIEEWKERNTIITISSLKSKLSSGDEQEVLDSLSRVQELCEERDTHLEWVVHENYLQERIAEVDKAIDSIVRSLARSGEEGKLAVALLLELAKNDMILGIIGKAQGCILHLVRISSSDNIQVANDAKELLEKLSFLDENAVPMAGANYFKPLLQRLCSGTDDVKKIMVTTLAEMVLTDHSKAALFKDGALTPLLELVSQGDTEMKTLSVRALQKLSSFQQNGLQMIREGAVHPLLNLLYRLNIASSSSLREQVAATIMNIAISVAPLQASEDLIFLDSEDDIFRLFSLINLTGPSIQRSILGTFYAICQPSSAGRTRTMLRQCSAISVLIRHCEATDPVVRANAVKLLSCLMQDTDDAMSAELLSEGCLQTVLSIIKTSSDEEEMAAAMGIISNLPMGNTQITEWLIDADALPIIVRFLSDAPRNISSQNQLIENAVGALRHFTVSTNHKFQKRAAEAGVIALLVRLLTAGTALTKQQAAVSLAQFSESSLGLSRPVEGRRGFFCCMQSPEIGCPVHLGVCSVETSFCLLEADAVGPLVKLLGERDPGLCEAALRALSTLVEGERLHRGSKLLDGLNGIMPMIQLLSSPSTELQEKSLRILEPIFRVEEYKRKFGSLAQMHLVDLIKGGNGAIRSLAALILGHLDVLHEQSSYF